MTDLYTLAAKHDKIKKEHAQKLIVAIAEEHPELKESLAQLYSFFMPAIPKKMKEINHEWVYKAVSKDPNKRRLHHLYSDGKHLIATNGDVVHYIKTDLPEGFYNRQGSRIEWDYSFIDLVRILDAYESGEYVEFNIKDSKIRKYGYDGKYYYEFDGIYFSKKIVDKFANGDELLKGTLHGLIANNERYVLKIEGEKSGLIVSKD